MKRLLLIVSAFAAATIGFAQTNAKLFDEHTAGAVPVTKQDLSAHSDGQAIETAAERMFRQQRGSGAMNVLWSEDFANGIPGNWQNTGHDLNQSGIPGIWEYRGPNTTPDTSIGSRGAYSGLSSNILRRIQSPTWTNGFVIFDSDYLDNGGTPGAFGQGPEPAPHYSELITNSIDLTGYPEVVLEFYFYTRNFLSNYHIEISNDDGQNWVYIDSFVSQYLYPYHTNIDGNQMDFLSLDISAVAGNQSAVKVKFVANTVEYYFLQMDDIRIIEKPVNDVAFIEGPVGALPQSISGHRYFTTKAVVNDRYTEIRQIPTMFSKDIDFLGVVVNQGQVAQPNTMIDVTYTGPTSGNNSSNALTAGVDSLYLLSTNSPFSAGGVGEYLVTATLSSDSTDVDPEIGGFRPNNNEWNTSITVTSNTYAVDGGTSATSFGTGTAASPQIGLDGARLGVLLEVTADDIADPTDPPSVYSVSMRISRANTRPGATLVVSVRDTLGGYYNSLQSDFQNKLCESDFYIVTLQDSIDGVVTVPIPGVLNGVPQSRQLYPGWFIVAVEMYSSGGTYPFAILDEYGTERYPFASIMFNPTANRWYTGYTNRTLNAIAIRPNIALGVNVDEVKSDVNFTLNPNPARDYVTMGINSEKVGNFHVVITNISGQVVKEMTYNSTNSISENVNVSDLSAGVYFVQVRSNDHSATKKLVIGR